MTRAELLQIFRSTASEIAEKDLQSVDESRVIAELGIDSLELLEVIGSLERDLNIRVPDDQLVGIQTVGQLITLVADKLPAKA
ncbi:MAG TPA: acyl carrier protein [Polyangiales bacterium]|jgi:acyl carrier protein|nr:acyl carrier protein [Polyangiales bacterium]